MLQYNTHNTKLPMPEYGRYVQQLVDKCVTIEDRDERNAFAAGIVATICNLFPQQKTSPEWRDKLWDHLAIMSDFKLDIDYPREVTAREDLESCPERLPLPGHDIRLRQCGNNVVQMIAAARAMAADDPERREFVMMIANHMKKLMLAVNPDGVEDARVCKDLAMLSDGELILNPEETPLLEFEVPAVMSAAKKKKRR